MKACEMCAGIPHLSTHSCATPTWICSSVDRASKRSPPGSGGAPGGLLAMLSWKLDSRPSAVCSASMVSSPSAKRSGSSQVRLDRPARAASERRRPSGGGGRRQWPRQRGRAAVRLIGPVNACWVPYPSRTGSGGPHFDEPSPCSAPASRRPPWSLNSDLPVTMPNHRAL